MCEVALSKVEPPISNTHYKTNTMYHMHTLGASTCMHVVHSVGFAMGVGDGCSGSTLFGDTSQKNAYTAVWMPKWLKAWSSVEIPGIECSELD